LTIPKIETERSSWMEVKKRQSQAQKMDGLNGKN